MNTETGFEGADRKAQLMSALAAIPANKHDWAKQCFRESESNLRKAIADGKTLSRVLQAFNETYGLKLSAPTFRKMLANCPGEVEG